MDLIERAAKKQAKKKKGISLVERAAETAEKNPFSGGIGQGIGDGIGASTKAKRDPSSMNPVAKPDEKPAGEMQGIGIGTPGKARKRKSEPKEPEVEERPKSLAIGHGVDEDVDSPQAKKTRPAKRRQAQKVEEVDLAGLREGGYITPDMPPNLMAEEFRIIKRSILLNAFTKGTQKSKNSNVVLVTSSNPGEGKTFCTINLALSIATEQDTTVLLIDADFSKPEVLNRLGVGGGRGLMDVVADSELEVGECLIRTNVPNLVLLPAGRQHNLTTELLASERMETIVDEIANRYPDRLVIFDSPPVLASSAASVMALYMGQTVFVIQAEQTTEPQIKESLNMISACENISLLLNQTRFNGSNKKFATYYGYGGR
jgi:protein-tyrosine kinase